MQNWDFDEDEKQKKINPEFKGATRSWKLIDGRHRYLYNNLNCIYYIFIKPPFYFCRVMAMTQILENCQLEYKQDHPDASDDALNDNKNIPLPACFASLQAHGWALPCIVYKLMPDEDFYTLSQCKRVHLFGD